MNKTIIAGSLLALGLVGCGGSSSSSSVTGDVHDGPAGVATLAFTDLQTLRPDMLTGATTLPSGVTQAKRTPAAAQGQDLPETGLSTTTYTFTNRKAANGGVINGTITVVAMVAGNSTTYTETFSLTVTPSAPVAGQTPAWTWVYAGSQQAVVTGDSAVLSIPSGGSVTLTYTDNAVSPATQEVFQFAIITPIQANWSVPQAVSLLGEYSFTETNGAESMDVKISPPLVWDTTASCDYPQSGTLTLAVTSQVSGSASTTIVFGPCGTATIGATSTSAGTVLNLGQ
jgi:hypothetical protein